MAYSGQVVVLQWEFNLSKTFSAINIHSIQHNPWGIDSAGWFNVSFFRVYRTTPFFNSAESVPKSNGIYMPQTHTKTIRVNEAVANKNMAGR